MGLIIYLYMTAKRREWEVGGLRMWDASLVGCLHGEITGTKTDVETRKDTSAEIIDSEKGIMLPLLGKMHFRIKNRKEKKKSRDKEKGEEKEPTSPRA